MAQINFPVATANGQTFEAPNGVIYTYNGTPPNGYWSGSFGSEGLNTLDARYVEKTGDNMSGDLTLGTDKITLDATTGSAAFAGSVQADQGVGVTRTTDNAVIGLLGTTPNENEVRLVATGGVVDLLVGNDASNTYTTFKPSGAVEFPSSATFAGTASFSGQTTHEGGVRVTGGSSGVNNGFIGNSNGTLVQTVVDGVPIARSILGSGGSGGFSFGGTGVKASTMVSILAESVRNGLVCDLRVDADETSSDITQGGNFAVEGPTTGTTGGVINFNNARLGSTFGSGNCTFTGEISGYRASINLGNLNTTGKVYGFHSGISQNNRFGDPAENYNFYAGGSAPNFFAGETWVGVGGVGASTQVIQLNSNGRIIATNSIISCSDRTNTPQFNNTGGVGVTLMREGTILQQYNSSTPAAGAQYINRTGSTTGKLIEFLYAATPGVNSQSAGVISLTSANSIGITETSDYRLKENIVDLPNATDRIKAIKPYQYNFKNEPAVIHEGFVAHELQDHSVLTVIGTKDEEEAIGTLADYDGTVLETEVTEPSAEELTYTEDVEVDGVSTATVRTRTWTPSGTRPVYQGVDQTKLIPLLTKALQEVMAKNEELETRLAALEGA
ncbi:tail fiber domain-containing protein [Synechococcus sp. AH-601-B19]|nr:tail fiber domain-containing protein [Synechococcus sp. AH-601-B19]